MGLAVSRYFTLRSRSRASRREEAPEARRSTGCRMNNISGADLLNLLILSLPVAAIAWTVTHEELFREFHDYCVARSENAQERCRSQVLLSVHL